jgi:hypothetical protein
VAARGWPTGLLSVQAGYLFNENPMPNNLAVFNIETPAVTKHTLSVGTTFQMNDSVTLSMAYVHGFRSAISGSLFPVAGASTTLDPKYDSVAFGLHIKFGGPRERATPTPVNLGTGYPPRTPSAGDVTSTTGAASEPR